MSDQDLVLARVSLSVTKYRGDVFVRLTDLCLWLAKSELESQSPAAKAVLKRVRENIEGADSDG